MFMYTFTYQVRYVQSIFIYVSFDVGIYVLYEFHWTLAIVKGKLGKRVFRYNVRCFLGIFDLPTLIRCFTTLA